MKKMMIRLHVNRNGKLVPIFKVLEINRLERKTKLLTNHEYIDYLIQKNLETENYERCAKLSEIKDKTAESPKRHRIVEN